jgi:enoyl-CoA hydratase/carnithine racemase
MELMVEGKTFTAKEALQLGLVTKVASGQKPFIDEAMEFASQFVPPHKPSMSVGLIKRAVLSGMEASFTEGLAIERELQQRLFISEDASEGLAAYHEKRKPNFKGR